MPLTPYHLIAGVAAKSIEPRYFSWTVFSLANICIDSESLYYFITTGIAYHKLFHTWIGATFIAIICAILGRYICEFFLKIWNEIILNKKYTPNLQRFHTDTNISNTSAWLSAFIGAYTHIFLDSFLNYDMKPYFPFSEKNHLLEIISKENIHLVCIALFFLGTIIYLVKSIKK